ncbi:hypothetical protein ARALYDRAFT_898338 [Arabidopsis lyrata subsp. lyrata]|uniref:F-box associated beta-propeller type 1 domain-containing protein n=1 Tax=Arabidopsis lyrata subsp. lyrata TaxID=81972 RepID=D7LA06_ARALL|nr:hypothetical protein ARALYDRAFT_898338 [Arabidopsis lyrata subsp. lyrata]
MAYCYASLGISRARLVVLNAYSGQNRFSVGYDSNNNHKILWVSHWFDNNEFHIYDFKSNVWRFLDVTTRKRFPWRSVSLKGNTYFTAVEKLKGQEEVKEYSLFCFDFTRERFGGRLPLPFHSGTHGSVILSTVREDKLAVLFNKFDVDETKIWVTTKIEPNAVTWSYFLKLDRKVFSGRRNVFEQNFFVDEKNKVIFLYRHRKEAQLQSLHY